MINKVGGSVDRVNSQLEKVDRITDSAVDAADSMDTAVRAVSLAVTRPVQKVSGLVTGMSFGAADFRVKKDWRHAVQAGKEAAARRERELADELREADAEPRPVRSGHPVPGPGQAPSRKCHELGRVWPSDLKPKSSSRAASVYMSVPSRTTAISDTLPRVAEATRHGPDLCVYPVFTPSAPR